MGKAEDIEAAAQNEGDDSQSEYDDLLLRMKSIPLSTRVARYNFCSLCGMVVIIPIIILILLSGIFFARRPAEPPAVPPAQCHPGMSRAEWRSLPIHKRHAYLAAVQRLTTLPSRLGLNTSLYDDFTYVHIQLTYQVHHAALSLPWHRYFLHVYEKTLKEEGKLDGILPYWDWTLDSSAPSESPIWDAFSGFGGNGTSPEGCVTDGILGSMTTSYVEDGYSKHCVTRNFNDDTEWGNMHGKQYTPEIVKDIIETSKTYHDFRERLEGGPHKHLHMGIGGEMPTISSTNDPLFFVHHAQIDRLWWLWQQRNPDVRSSAFSGPVGSDMSTVPGVDANLEDEILMLDLAEDVTVRDVMTTDTHVLCYKYDMSY